MTDHFLKQNEGKDVKERTEDDIEMQAAFGGKLKRWVKCIDWSTIEVDEGNASPWEAVKVLLTKNILALL